MRKKQKKLLREAQEYSESHRLVSRRKIFDLVLGGIIAWVITIIFPIMISILSDVGSTRIMIYVSIIMATVWAFSSYVAVRALLTVFFHIHDDMKWVIDFLGEKIRVDIKIVDNESRIMTMLEKQTTKKKRKKKR